MLHVAHRAGVFAHDSERLPRVANLSTEETSTELSARRTGMSFQRSRMSADRTMMSIIRTSLSLIGFGFTIYQFFGRLQTDKILSSARHAPRNFGLALVSLGLALLTLGIVYHLRYMGELRAERTMMTRQGLIHGETSYPISLTVVTAALLWIIGALAIVSMVFRSGPFN